MIFGPPKQESTTYTQVRMLDGFTPTFTPFSGDAYDSDVVRSAIDAIARNGAKLQPKHIRRNDTGIVQPQSQLDYLLAVRPNRLMDAYTFYYKVVTQLYMRNNAFIYPEWDDRTGLLKALWPVLSSTVELLQARKDPTGELFVRFRFVTGETKTVPYSEMIHLRRFFFRSDLWGESNEKALTPTLELVKATDEGIINAIKSSAFLRGLLKFTGMLKPDDIKKQRDSFVKDYMDVSNNGGIAATDSKAEYQELKTEPKMISGPQMKVIKEKVYDYFGVNEKIIRSTYTENDWNAFYESVIEPLAIQMSLEFTSKLFTDRERGHGNEVVFEANRLQYASMTTKLNLMQMVDRGAMTPNEWRAALNLAPLEGGDKPIRRLDTAEVNSNTEGGDGNGRDDGDSGSDSEGS